MIKYICDRCNAMLEKERIRYQLRIELFAAFDGLEFSEKDLRAGRDTKKEIADLIRRLEDMDPRQLEDQVHVKFEYDLCQKCRDEVYRQYKEGSGIGQEG